ncbi:MAG TPA: hypothetical protein VFA26_15845, partial [Gemmataceae bacterium]|nr:hypothetical protein [Gemmataceae bacterium]
HYLEKVAVGFALDSKGQSVIATPKQLPPGVSLGLIGQNVFEKNEEGLRDVPQVARSRTMCVFDATKALMLREGKHQRMVIRHVVLVNPADGKVQTLVWLLGPGRDGGLVPAEDAMQLLPPGLKEDRVINVKKEKFGVLGIPAEDAFAMVRIPQGTPVKWTPDLQKVAAVRTFTADSAAQLEAELRKALANVKAP